MGLNAIEQARISRKLVQNSQLLRKLELFLAGQPLGTARFADAAIEAGKIVNLSVDDAKINDLSVDKLTAGILSVVANIGSSGDAGYVKVSGVDNNIVIAEDVSGSPLPRILLGADSGGIMKLKISKPTFNVLTETDNKNLVFNSALNHLKTAGSGTVTKTVSAHSTASETLAHGLGINPMMLGYFRDTSDSKWYITMSQPVGDIFGRAITNINVTHYVDTTNIYFKFFNNNGSSKTIELQFEFFYEGN